MKGENRNRCTNCGAWTHAPEGEILKRLAQGKTICEGCGRFQIYCPCGRKR